MNSLLISLTLLAASCSYANAGFTGRSQVLECPYELQGNNSLSCPNVMNGSYAGGSPLPIVTDKVGYADGFVMTHPIALYLFWYGEWDPMEKATIKLFLESLTNPPVRGGTTQTEASPSLYSWWNTMTQYHNQYGQHASSTIRVFDRYHLNIPATSTSLSFSDIESIIGHAVLPVDGIGPRLIPGDPWGIYVFLPAPGIQVDGYCSVWCAIHSKMTDPKWKEAGLVYVVVGYPGSECIPTCSPFGEANPTLTPPHSQAVDTIINALAHEIGESPVNNDQAGWGDAQNGLQIGDLCNFDFGDSSNFFTASNGGTANIHGINGSEFFIQSMWSNKANGCVMQT